MKLRDLPIALNPRAVSLAEGARAGIAVAAMLIVAQLFNLPHFDLAALGALLTCFADPGGTMVRRASAVIAFALCSLVAYAVFGFLRGEGLWISALLAGLAIFAASYVRVYGQVGQQVGSLLSIVIVLALGTPLTSLHQAGMAGLNFAAGAAWAVLLTLVIWRLHPYAPSRRVVADVCRRLAELTKELASLAHAEETVAAFEEHAARHRREVREAIEAARTVAFETFRGRGLVSPRGAQLTLRLQSLELIFEALIALSDTLESDPACRAQVVRPVRLIATWLAVIGPEIEADKALDTAKKQASLQRLRAALEPLPAESEARHVHAGHGGTFRRADRGDAVHGAAAARFGDGAAAAVSAHLRSAAAEFFHLFRGHAPCLAHRHRRHAGSPLVDARWRALCALGALHHDPLPAALFLGHLAAFGGAGGGHGAGRPGGGGDRADQQNAA